MGRPDENAVSCASMPEAFFFAPPGPEVPGAYARCASYAAPTTVALAVSPDGTRAALVGATGRRIVDVATSVVVGVLAPPRDSISRAAFSASATGS